MYISQKGLYKPRKDLLFYSHKKIEPMFIELLIPNKQNYLIRMVYKHPVIQHIKFNDGCITSLLSKLKTENKATIVAGEFNLNMINYTQVRGAHQFLKTLLSDNFIPQITLPKRVTKNSVTLIDNIFSDNHDHKCISGNATTSISDHLPQVLIIGNLKQTPLRKDVKISFKNIQSFNETDLQNELKELDWSVVT